ncbi:hypothetical protein AB0G85_37075 [Streptomyces sioyaensis]|uniref:hypothetical protein n=1 Tax=Streptomyces sioyaensis TaxID=67364 RepID=UPI0033E00B87
MAPRKQPVAPAEIGKMSPLELRVFAYLAWASAANRPVTFREIGHLPLSTGDLVGVRAAVKTTRDLADTGLVTLLGQTGILHAPLTVLVAGHQPKAPVSPPPARQPLTHPKSGTPAPGQRARFIGPPDPSAERTLTSNQVRGGNWALLPEHVRKQRRLWGLVQGKGPAVCSHLVKFHTSRGSHPTREEFTLSLGWQPGSPSAEALQLLIDSGWLSETESGQLGTGTGPAPPRRRRKRRTPPMSDPIYQTHPQRPGPAFRYFRTPEVQHQGSPAIRHLGPQH